MNPMYDLALDGYGRRLSRRTTTISCREGQNRPKIRRMKSNGKHKHLRRSGRCAERTQGP